MCRLTAFYPTRGLAGWELKTAATMATILLRENAIAGNKDGCGISDPFGLHLTKFEESAALAVERPEFLDAIKVIADQAFIGHTRLASTGYTAKEGAHPFQVGHILVAHNGTFNNHLGIKAKLNIEETMVDSHIFAYLLSQMVGEKEVTSEDIAKALEEVTGSYALLITDTLNGNIWVVRGANSLYIAKCGPLWVVNTIGETLLAVHNLVNILTHLNYGKSWEITKPELVTEYSINRLTATGLEKVADIKRPVVQTTTHKNKYNTEQTTTGDTARELGKSIAGLFAIPFVNWEEIEIGTSLLFGCAWFEMSKDQVAILDMTFQNIQNKYATGGKMTAWETIQRRLKGNAYTDLDEIIKFPYVVHTQKELDDFVRLTDDFV